jgi:hypothetical protein
MSKHTLTFAWIALAAAVAPEVEGFYMTTWPGCRMFGEQAKISRLCDYLLPRPRRFSDTCNPERDTHKPNAQIISKNLQQDSLGIYGSSSFFR